jgi:hypothetical protein
MNTTAVVVPLDRLGSAFKPGIFNQEDLVAVRDEHGVWVEARVIGMYDGEHVGVRFNGQGWIVLVSEGRVRHLTTPAITGSE